ncbi:hypothetical protein AB4Z09_22875 [Rhodococcus sp. TAF43]
MTGRIPPAAKDTAALSDAFTPVSASVLGTVTATVVATSGVVAVMVPACR